MDWESMGINPEGYILTAPDIKDFQKADRFDPNALISMASKEGLLLYLKRVE